MCPLRCLPASAVLSATLLAGHLFAQATEERSNVQTSSSTDANVGNTERLGSVDTTSGSRQSESVPALDGTGLISMDGAARMLVLVGGAISGGWDTNPSNTSDGRGSGMYTVSPYLGLQTDRDRTKAVFQYQPTVTGYSSGYAQQVIHRASLVFLGNPNERWRWNFSAAGSHGNDSVRFLSNQTVAVGTVPGSAASSAAYLQNAGTVTYFNGGLDVEHHESARDSINFRVGNSSIDYTGSNGTNSIATSSIRYTHDSTPSLGLFAYAQSYFYYGLVNCQNYGSGVGLKWEAREKTYISLSGGPQISAPSCARQQGFSYNAALSTHLSEQSQVYFLAAREPTSSYLGPGLWQTSASGGYQRQVTSIGTVGVDLGYVQSETLTTASSYRGIYFSCVYRYQVARELSASYSYRGYFGDSGGASLNRQVAVFSLTWTPNTGRILK
jgi:hypothetical protein